MRIVAFAFLSAAAALRTARAGTAASSGSKSKTADDLQKDFNKQLEEAGGSIDWPSTLQKLLKMYDALEQDKDAQLEAEKSNGFLKRHLVPGFLKRPSEDAFKAAEEPAGELKRVVAKCGGNKSCLEDAAPWMDARKLAAAIESDPSDEKRARTARVYLLHLGVNYAYALWSAASQLPITDSPSSEEECQAVRAVKKLTEQSAAVLNTTSDMKHSLSGTSYTLAHHAKSLRRVLLRCRR